MKKIKPLRKSKFSTILIILFIIALFAQHFVFAPLAKAAVNTSQGWEGDYSWSGKNIILNTANGEIIFSLDSTTGNDVNFSAKKWLDSVYQNRLGQNSPAEEDLHISLIKGDDPRQAKLWCRYISTYAVDTKMLPSACAATSSNDYLSGNIEIKNVKNGATELNKVLGLIGCPPQKKKDGDKNYACLGGGAVVDGEYDKDGKPPENPKRTGEEDDGGETADQSQEANCSQALSPFGWVLCPATNFADDLYSLFKQLVNDILFFESDKYQNNGLYNSWKIMVTLANTILVLVAIVMIAAQIFNFEFISAYTVKKALPRIVIAAILIQLSWFMVTTGIQIVNAIGSGIYWLLVAPFASQIDVGNNDGIMEIGPILAQNYSGTDVGNGAGNAAVFYFAMMGLGAAAVGAAVSGLWLTVIIAAIGVVISLLVAIVTLVIREVLLIVLIAIAPLAIAMWILPGTTGLWSLWWKTFSRLLMMYPLIMLLFAGGTIAAILLASTGSGINILFAIIAFFAPMFMIGATYKFAGGAFASIASMTGKLGDKAKGIDMFGLRTKEKESKENYQRRKSAIRQSKNAQDVANINDTSPWTRFNARRRTGTLMSLSKNAQRYRDALEASGLDTATQQGKQLLLKSGINSQATLRDEHGREITYPNAYLALAEGKKITATHLGRETVLDGADYGTRNAAISTAVENGQISTINSMRNSENVQTRQLTERAIEGSSNIATQMPHWLKGEDKAFGNITIDQARGWKPEAAIDAIQHLSGNRYNEAAAGEVTKDMAWNRFADTLETSQSNPGTQKIDNATLSAIKNTYVVGTNARMDRIVTQITDEGTFHPSTNPPPSTGSSDYQI